MLSQFCYYYFFYYLLSWMESSVTAVTSPLSSMWMIWNVEHYHLFGVACSQELYDASYCQYIKNLASWFDDSFLGLNLTKTKELCQEGNKREDSADFYQVCQLELCYSNFSIDRCVAVINNIIWQKSVRLDLIVVFHEKKV